MNGYVKPTKTEKILLAITALFLCVMVALLVYTRATGSGGAYTVETQSAAASSELVPDLSPVNINTATQEKLASLPGIGPALAQRIVEYREAHGAFASVEELDEVSGIGEGKLGEIRDRITVEG